MQSEKKPPSSFVFLTPCGARPFDADSRADRRHSAVTELSCDRRHALLVFGRSRGETRGDVMQLERRRTASPLTALSRLEDVLSPEPARPSSGEKFSLSPICARVVPPRSHAPSLGLRRRA